MKNFFKTNHNNTTTKQPFFPYQDKVRTSYFSYSGLFWILGIWVSIFSIFLIVNLSINNRYHISNQLKDINLCVTPVFNLVLVVLSWILLLFAPSKVYQSPKRSSVMFYFSFWFLVVAILLNAQLQLNYINEFKNNTIYHWMNSVLAQIFIILSVFALIAVQWFFWIMRRKFAFMPTDYDIYLQRSMNKKERRAKKRAIKAQNRLVKQNAKLATKKS